MTGIVDAFVRCDAPEPARCRGCRLLGGTCFPPVGPTADERRAVELLVGGLAGRGFSELRVTVEQLRSTADEGGAGMAAAVALTLAEAGREELERAARTLSR